MGQELGMLILIFYYSMIDLYYILHIKLFYMIKTN